MITRLNSKPWFFISLIFFSILWGGCSEENPSVNPGNITRHPYTFTFFKVGINSILSKNLRGDLNGILGSDAIQHKNSIDLTINYPGFLKRYFPHLHELNEILNFPPRERVEHNTSRLTYRYATEKNLAFDFVEFLFSDYNQTPLLIRVHFKINTLNSLKILKEKYGDPKSFTWKEKYGDPKSVTWEKKNGNSLFWEKNSDLLIYSTVPDQIGNPTYQIVIFFTKRLEEFLTTEAAEKDKNMQKTLLGKKAF